VIQGQMLQQFLRDAAQLDMQMVGVQFAPDGITMGLAFAVQMLVALSAAPQFHGGHPEMIGITPDDMHSLAKASSILKR
ncbi:MAG: hypothetical protein ACLGQU_11145, partial [Acidobacteriota bacterium]